MKKIRYVILVLIAIVTVVYFYIDGWIPYKIQKAVISPLQLVEYYSCIEFPIETEINNVNFRKITDSTLHFEEEHFTAELLVPSSEIDRIFPEKGRNYHLSNAPLNIEEIDFSYEKTNMVRRWTVRIPRGISFYVMKSKDEFTKIYVSIGMLGWYLDDEWRLGGIN